MSTNIFQRLREERERLGKTQDEFAAIAGVTRRPYAEWERAKGNTTPSAQCLAALAVAGADVMYIVTGQRSSPVSPQELLPADERIMLDNYRHAPDAVKAGIKQTLGAFAPKVGATHRKMKRG